MNILYFKTVSSLKSCFSFWLPISEGGTVLYPVTKARGGEVSSVLPPLCLRMHHLHPLPVVLVLVHSLSSILLIVTEPPEWPFHFPQSTFNMTG